MPADRWPDEGHSHRARLCLAAAVRACPAGELWPQEGHLQVLDMFVPSPNMAESHIPASWQGSEVNQSELGPLYEPVLCAGPL